MSRWRASAALSRSLVVGGLGIGLAVLFGEPLLVVLVAPLLVCAAMALVHRPVSSPTAETRLDHQVLHEGQGTTSRLVLQDADDAEQVTRVVAAAPYVALRPADGAIGSLVGEGAPLPQIEVSPRRWGRRVLGDEKVGLSSVWGGYQWGPVSAGGQELSVLPVTAPFDSRAEAPQPLGLIGAHRSRRLGQGTEFAGIRPFQAGDRLRRIHWRVSLRTDELHVVTARAEEDTGVLLVVDGLADHGRSGGIDGDASSLDVTMRAAAALAEHHIRTGDRVALRVVGAGGELVGYGAGRRHLRKILGRLAQVRPGESRHLSSEPPTFRAPAGTVVFVLSPMLAETMGSVAATLVRRGLPVLVIDTLPEDATPAVTEGTDPFVADLAWRMRRTERDTLLDRLARSGCPVVAWRGPGTLDDVLHRLARRAQLPQVRAR